MRKDLVTNVASSISPRVFNAAKKGGPKGALHQRQSPNMRPRLLYRGNDGPRRRPLELDDNQLAVASLDVEDWAQVDDEDQERKAMRRKMSQDAKTAMIYSTPEDLARHHAEQQRRSSLRRGSSSATPNLGVNPFFFSGSPTDQNDSSTGERKSLRDNGSWKIQMVGSSNPVGGRMEDLRIKISLDLEHGSTAGLRAGKITATGGQATNPAGEQGRLSGGRARRRKNSRGLGASSRSGHSGTREALRRIWVLGV